VPEHLLGGIGWKAGDRAGYCAEYDFDIPGVCIGQQGDHLKIDISIYDTTYSGPFGVDEVLLTKYTDPIGEDAIPWVGHRTGVAVRHGMRVLSLLCKKF